LTAIDKNHRRSLCGMPFMVTIIASMWSPTIVLAMPSSVVYKHIRRPRNVLTRREAFMSRTNIALSVCCGHRNSLRWTWKESLGFLCFKILNI
jgi:hypothetical protein